MRSLTRYTFLVAAASLTTFTSAFPIVPGINLVPASVGSEPPTGALLGKVGQLTPAGLNKSPYKRQASANVVPAPAPVTPPALVVPAPAPAPATPPAAPPQSELIGLIGDLIPDNVNVLKRSASGADDVDQLAAKPKAAAPVPPPAPVTPGLASVVNSLLPGIHVLKREASVASILEDINQIENLAAAVQVGKSPNTRRARPNAVHALVPPPVPAPDSAPTSPADPLDPTANSNAPAADDAPASPADPLDPTTDLNAPAADDAPFLHENGKREELQVSNTGVGITTDRGSTINVVYVNEDGDDDDDDGCGGGAGDSCNGSEDDDEGDDDSDGSEDARRSLHANTLLGLTSAVRHREVVRTSPKHVDEYDDDDDEEGDDDSDGSEDARRSLHIRSEDHELNSAPWKKRNTDEQCDGCNGDRPSSFPVFAIALTARLGKVSEKIQKSLTSDPTIDTNVVSGHLEEMKAVMAAAIDDFTYLSQNPNNGTFVYDGQVMGVDAMGDLITRLIITNVFPLLTVQQTLVLLAIRTDLGLDQLIADIGGLLATLLGLVVQLIPSLVGALGPLKGIVYVLQLLNFGAVSKVLGL